MLQQLKEGLVCDESGPGSIHNKPLLLLCFILFEVAPEISR
jgi:hypothetical protein